MKFIRTKDKGSKALLEEVIGGRTQKDTEEMEERVRKILLEIKKEGDQAVLRYSRSFSKISEMRIPEKMIKNAIRSLDRKALHALEVSAERIKRFHEKEIQNSWFTVEDGAFLGQLKRPLRRVGVYVPGGKAAYPSSVLMNVLPARVAGVSEIAMCVPTPRGEINPYVLAAADITGVTEIYRVGGAQAIGAMAYGTKTIPKVDKIVGPGNIYVATAKRLVFGTVDIDMVAGPSEILIIADEKADPQFIVEDLLSQAEHDELASSVLVTNSEAVARKTREEVARKLKRTARRAIAEKALENYGAIIVTKDLLEAASIANEIAPEHLEIMVERPFELLDKIKNAGAIFLGYWTPEALGDYSAGPNHVLPTGGTAKFFSPLGVDDFVKRTSLLSFSKEGLDKLGDTVLKMADMEGLAAHRNSVSIRLRKGSKAKKG